jgi:hypothetical protein
MLDPTKKLPPGWIGESDGELAAPFDLVEDTLGPGTGLIAGPSSAGKTALAVSLAVAAGMGQPWFGRRMREPMGSAIIVGEGVGGLKRRFAAARLDAGIAPEQRLPIAWLPSPGRLIDEKLIEKTIIPGIRGVNAYFADALEISLRFIFIDTLSACFGLEDENGGAPGAKAIRLMNEMAMTIGGLALAIHHPPKNGAGERGSGAFRANSDFVLTASCDRDDETGEVRDRRVAVTKNRDGETGPIGAYELKKIVLPDIFNHWGDPVSSIVAVPVNADHIAPAAAGAADQARRRERGSNDMEVTFFRAFWEACNKHGFVHFIGGDHRTRVKAVRLVEHVRPEFVKFYATGEEGERREGAIRMAWSRMCKTLGQRGFATEMVKIDDKEIELVWSPRSQSDGEIEGDVTCVT